MKNVHSRTSVAVAFNLMRYNMEMTVVLENIFFVYNDNCMGRSKKNSLIGIFYQNNMYAGLILNLSLNGQR